MAHSSSRAGSSSRYNPIDRTSGAPLRRGKACLNCRYLKIKCDGNRPICTPCQKNPKEDECEYADGPRSRTKALEETINSLKGRIHELENPDETPSVQLHDPYSSTPPDTQHLPHLSLQSMSPAADSPLSLPAVSSPHGHSPAHSHTTDSPVLNVPSSTPTHSRGSASPHSPVRRDDTEPSFSQLQNLVDAFLHHGEEIGFFLNSERFRAACLMPAPLGHPSRPCASLINAVCLWGTQFTHFGVLVGQEHIYESRAVQSLAADVSSTHPSRILHVIQAHVLLANYYFRGDRYVEANYHSNAATSLALTSGLHRVAALDASPQAAGPSSFVLAPPADSVEIGERLGALWNVYLVDRMLCSTLAPTGITPSLFDTPGGFIELPWPLDPDAYQKGASPPISRDKPALWSFLRALVDDSPGAFSSLTLKVKAAVLLHRAQQLWSHGSMQEHDAQFQENFKRLDMLTANLRTSIIPLNQLDASQGQTNFIATHYLLVTHGLLDAATIILNGPFIRTDSHCRKKCLDSAASLIQPGTVDFSVLPFVNPVFASLWFTALRTVIDELTALHSQSSSYHSPSPSSSSNTPHSSTPTHGQAVEFYSELHLQNLLQTGTGLLNHFSSQSPLMSESFRSLVRTTVDECSSSLWRHAVTVTTMPHFQCHDSPSYTYAESCHSEASSASTKVDEDSYFWTEPTPAGPAVTYSHSQHHISCAY